MKILIETSARHVHLSKKDLYSLFGAGHELSKKKDLSQPGQFLCKENVKILGPRGIIKNISVLGPNRSETQIEFSMTDCINLGIKADIRESGHLEGTAGCKIIGPKGEINIEEGVIISKRHIHLDPRTASDFNLKNGENVKVKVKSKYRSLIFDDVVIRVDDKYFPAMHIDTDEANAAGIENFSYGNIIKREP